MNRTTLQASANRALDATIADQILGKLCELRRLMTHTFTADRYDGIEPGTWQKIGALQDELGCYFKKRHGGCRSQRAEEADRLLGISRLHGAAQLTARA